MFFTCKYVIRHFEACSSLNCHWSKVSELSPNSCPLATAWTLVLLDVLSLSGSNFDTFTMEPSLAHITTDPEFISAIILTASATGCTLFIIIFFFSTLVLFFRWCRHLHSLGLRLRWAGLYKGSIQTGTYLSDFPHKGSDRNIN